MAPSIPAHLKAAAPDVQRFATRAAQLASHRPVVTYWCEYYILQQLLSRQLHACDEECTAYAGQLMDRLEVYKADNAANDAVVDDVAAKAYIEHFALDVFTGGDEAQRNNRVTRQTADTFQAAATFMDLLAIWGPLEPEIAAKSKFAKYHALRIARAIKAGHDPNATNPVEERLAEPPSEELSLEQELKKLEHGPSSPLPAPSSSLLPPHSTAPPTRDTNDAPPTQPPENDVSPIEPADHVARGTGSIGGGYFPSVPPPSAPAPADFYNTPHPPAATPHPHTPPPPVPAPAPPPAARAPLPPAHPTDSHAAPPAGGYRDDDESITAAQKHAKWALSALNFEDVQTAVKELRLALQSLGAG